MLILSKINPALNNRPQVGDLEVSRLQVGDRWARFSKLQISFRAR